MALERHPALLSYEDFRRLPPESPGEVIHGELVVGPSPVSRHQQVAGTLYRLIAAFLDTAPALGEVYIAPLDVVLRAERPAIVVQPDVFFVAAARAGIVQDFVEGPPDLAVEVVSPGSGRTDAVVKRDLYAAHGVREYWIVWPAEARIDVFVLEPPKGEATYGTPRTFGVGEPLTSALLPGFSLDVARLLQSRPQPT